MADVGASEFDTAVAVSSDGNTAIVAGWDIYGNANGGYLLALVASGMLGVAQRVDPITITGHYLAPGKPGPARVETTIIKAGRLLTTARAELIAEGRTLLHVVGSFGSVDRAAEAVHVAGAPPELPPIAECVSRTDAQVDPPEFIRRLDVRLRPDNPPGEVAGWFAFADGRPVDTLALLLVCDSFLPAVFSLPVPTGWVPTIEYTVHVRGVPAPGPVRVVFRTRFVIGGYLEEDGEVWDSTGRLVAMSRQLGLVARP